MLVFTCTKLRDWTLSGDKSEGLVDLQTAPIDSASQITGGKVHFGNLEVFEFIVNRGTLKLYSKNTVQLRGQEFSGFRASKLFFL